MGSINDVGIPGNPLSEPPLTDWQEAVRDALNGSDIPLDSRFLKLSGGTLSGYLDMIPVGDDADLIIRAEADKHAAITFYKNGLPRWQLIQDADLETGGNLESDLRLYRYDDTGVSLGIVMGFTRATGQVTVSQAPTGPSSIATKAYVDGLATEADVVMQAGWNHTGGSGGNVKVTRHGPIVIMQGNMTRTSDLAVTDGTWYHCFTIPDGFRPDAVVHDHTQYQGAWKTVRMSAGVDGTFQVRFEAAFGTATAGTAIGGMAMMWRAA